MRIAVSGANGFVGRALCTVLGDAGHHVIALVRRAGGIDPRCEVCIVGNDNFASLAEGRPALGACDAFVHLAARVHVMSDSAPDSLSLYRAANVDGAINAARAALRAGAVRFVFVSSVKALGEGEPGRPWRESDTPEPADPYGISKHEAERALVAFGLEHGMDVVIVRPPLVYGPGVRANFLGLMRAVNRGIPLPLGAVQARRSMVYVGNLADAIRVLATAAGPLGGVYHATDCHDLSVAEMIRAIADALGRPARLVPVPIACLHAAGKLLRQSSRVERLTSPLRMECVRLRKELGWTPPWTVSEGLTETVRNLVEHD